MRVLRGQPRVQAPLRPPWFLSPRRSSAAVRAPAVGPRTIREVAGVALESPRLRRRMPHTAATEATVPARRQGRAAPGTGRPFDLLRTTMSAVATTAATRFRGESGGRGFGS